MKKPGLIFIILLPAFISKAQPPDCIFKPSRFTIHFGTGNIRDVNTTNLSNYQRVAGACPTDGHYSFTSSTGGCFRGDWHTLSTDHTPGDKSGNMLLVNASWNGGIFFNMPVTGLKSNTVYELGLWVINLCRPTRKCPFVLLPSLRIRLETPEGKTIANIVTRGLPRIEEPVWSQHRAYFTTPASTSVLRLIMEDNAPGGCGNDFALDDITFRECVKQKPRLASPQNKPPVEKKAVVSKPATKKVVNTPKKKVQDAPAIKAKPDTALKIVRAAIKTPKIVHPTPMVFKTRENVLVKKIETETGEIKINLYDNGEIDGDTVSIYHNNKLVKSRMRLSEKPISITIAVNASQPHHELVMVAENLGSIPPNTSVMIISTPAKRYQVLISSSEQKNAKVVFDLKK